MTGKVERTVDDVKSVMCGKAGSRGWGDWCGGVWCETVEGCCCPGGVDEGAVLA